MGFLHKSIEYTYCPNPVCTSTKFIFVEYKIDVKLSKRSHNWWLLGCNMHSAYVQQPVVTQAAFIQFAQYVVILFATIPIFVNMGGKSCVFFFVQILFVWMHIKRAIILHVSLVCRTSFGYWLWIFGMKVLQHKTIVTKY